jgi:signal transduction histidine kinase
MSRFREISARQGDLLLAAAVTALLVGELLVEDIGGPAVVNYLFGVVITVALYWWRRLPVYATGVQLLAAITATALNGRLVQDPFAPFFALLIGFYGVGRYAPERWSYRGLFFGVLGIVLINLAGAGGSFGDYVFPMIIAVGAPWLAGRAVRVWAKRARELAWANKLLRAEQDRRSELAVAEERSRIARELHDVVAHAISVMVVQAEGAKRMTDREPERAKQALDQIEETGRGALTEMRRLLGVLRKGDEGVRLGPQPGAESLFVLVERASDAGLEVDIRFEGPRRPLPPGVDVTVYRIVQEALTNSIKHAGPGSADVVIRYGHDALELEVVDNGPSNGFVAPPPDADNPQHGLLGMKERVKVYGGEVVTGPCEDGADGYRVWARIPLTAA